MRITGEKMRGHKRRGLPGKIVIGIAVIILLVGVINSPLQAQPFELPDINLSVEGGTGGPESVSRTLQLLAILTVLTLAPAILILLTSFTRVIVVLSFLRSALATQQMPPNQVLIGLALFLTFFIMAPTWKEINANALQPYMQGEMGYEEAFQTAMSPLREFMFKQTREKDLALFVELSDIERPQTYQDIPNYVLIPSFIISELKTAFQIGFMLYVPFLVIDMIVSSALMSMGMLMLPPMMISLPFKVLLFVLVDGWNLVIHSLILSFR